MAPHRLPTRQPCLYHCTIVSVCHGLFVAVMRALELTCQTSARRHDMNIEQLELQLNLQMQLKPACGRTDCRA